MKQLKDNMWPINADISERSNYDFYETNDGKYGIYFSNIDEYGGMKFSSPVQIWANKQQPKLLFQSKKIKFEFQQARSCYYLEKSNIIVLLTPCSRNNDYDLLYILLDLKNNKFAVINAPNFDLEEIDKNEIRYVLNFRYSYDEETKDKISKEDGETFYLNESTWYNIDRLHKACIFVFG